MATIGLRTLFMVGTAAYTGNVLYHNLDSVRTLASRLLNLPKPDNNNGSNGSTSNGSSSAVDALAKQLEYLSNELKRAKDAPVVVVPATSRSATTFGVLSTITDALNLLGWVIVLGSVGGVGYYVAVKRNVKLRDLAWVSRGRFNETVAAMERGVGRMRGVVSAVKRELGERLRLLDGRVDDVKVISERIGDEVGEVRVGVEGLGMEMWKVKGAVDEVGERVESMDGKLSRTNDGIYALVKLVYGALGGSMGRGGGELGELKRFMLDMEIEKEGGGDAKIEPNAAGKFQARLEGEGSKVKNGLLSLVGGGNEGELDLAGTSKGNPSASWDANRGRKAEQPYLRAFRSSSGFDYI